MSDRGRTLKTSALQTRSGGKFYLNTLPVDTELKLWFAPVEVEFEREVREVWIDVSGLETRKRGHAWKKRELRSVFKTEAMQISVAKLLKIATFKTDTLNAVKIKLQMSMIQKLKHSLFGNRKTLVYRIWLKLVLPSKSSLTPFVKFCIEMG